MLYDKKTKYLNIKKLKSIARYQIIDRYNYRKACRVLQQEITPVAVYTMAKVASSSIYHSINNQTTIPVYHIHTLDKKINEQAELSCQERGIVPASRPVGDLIYQFRIKANRPLKIITSVREPIERNISAFFEAFEYYLGIPPKLWEGDIDQLVQAYYKYLPHEFPLEWFDKEFLRMTSINVFEKSFDVTKKSITYTDKNIEVLLLRTDLNDNKMSEEIRRFLGVSTFTLNSHNIGEQKPYAELYNKFKKKIFFNQDYLTNMLESKYTKHFYSENEIFEFYEKYEANA